ncbi:MAG TPA: DoxX family protein [Verrucomicrobiae bacterium]|nr:DoxX family protein [Verrucomicrobiae bacterium]
MDTNTGTQITPKKSVTRFFPHIARVLLGLMFLLFGLNGFLNFIPVPKDIPQDIITVSMALMKAGYMNVVSAVEIIVAVLLLVNRFVPLALTLLAPILVGILTFHIAIQPSTIGPGIVVTLLELFLAYSYRKAFSPMLAAKVKPCEKCSD